MYAKLKLPEYLWVTDVITESQMEILVDSNGETTNFGVTKNQEYSRISE